MRKDCDIDRKQVTLKNASTIGYGEWKARAGDFITYRFPSETDAVHFGRIAGRVKVHSNAFAEAGRVFLLVIGMSDELTHSFERWVNPDDVLTCVRPENFDARALLYVLSPDFMKEDVDTVRRAFEGGWSTPTAYKDERERRRQADVELRRREEKGEV